MGADPGVSEERILILAPIGRDSEVLRLVLGRAGLAVEVCDTIDAVVAELRARSARARWSSPKKP